MLTADRRLTAEKAAKVFAKLLDGNLAGVKIAD